MKKYNKADMDKLPKSRQDVPFDPSTMSEDDIPEGYVLTVDQSGNQILKDCRVTQDEAKLADGLYNPARFLTTAKPGEMGIPPWYWKLKTEDGMLDPLKAGKFNPAELANFVLSEDKGFHATVIDGTVAIWDSVSSRYQIGEERISQFLTQLCRDYAGHSFKHLIPNAKGIKETIEMIQLAVPVEDRDKRPSPMLIGVKKDAETYAVVDMEKFMAGDKVGCLIENKPEYHVINYINHVYDPNASHTLIDKFLEDVTDGVETRKANLLEIIGHSLFPAPAFEVAPILYAPRGANGKSTYLNILRTLIGEENTSAESIADFGGNFMLFPLEHKLLNVTGELAATTLKEKTLSVVKMLTGTDPIKIHYKHLNYSKDRRFYATLVTACNKLPRMTSGDANGGTMRRFEVVIPFMHHFDPKDPNTDARIVEKLTTENAMSYLLLLGLEALARMLAKNSANPYTESEESYQLWREMYCINDPFESFCEDEGVTAEWFVVEVPFDTVNRYRHLMPSLRNPVIISTTGSTAALADYRKVLPYELAYGVYEGYCTKNGIAGKLSAVQFYNKAKQMFGLERKKVYDTRYVEPRKHRAFYNDKIGVDTLPSWMKNDTQAKNATASNAA